MELCTIIVCIIYCIQFDAQRSSEMNKFFFLFLFQSRHDYLCCSARHTHVQHLLQLTCHRYNHQCVQKLFGDRIRLLYIPSRQLFSSSICSRHVFCVKVTYLAKNGHVYTVKSTFFICLLTSIFLLCDTKQFFLSEILKYLQLSI